MLEDYIVIGLVMTLVQVVKVFWLSKLNWNDEQYSVFSALLVLLLAAGLQVANAAIFDATVPLRTALAHGILLGALSGGIYSIGKTVLDAARGTGA